MATQLCAEPVDLPTQTLFEQVISKHVGRMKAELMSIRALEVARLQRECASLRQQVSLLQGQSGSDGSHRDHAVIGKDVGGELKGDSVSNDIEEVEEVPVSPPHRQSSHILIPELGVARMSDRQTDRIRAMLDTKGWRADLQKFVHHPAFEGLSLFVVTFNVVLLGVQANELSVTEGGNSFAKEGFVMEMICCVFFIVEVGMRIVANWSYFFLGPGWVLNWLDFVLVATQSFDLCLSLVLMDGDSTVNFAMWRMLRMARVVRLFRSAKLLVMFAEVRSTALAAILAIKPLCGAMIVMILFCYGFSIILVEIAYEERDELEVSTEDVDIERRQTLKFHFGDIGSSILTLLHCSLGTAAGYHFSEISLLFSSWWVRDLLIPAFMVLSTLGMMNIITGIFVESTTRQIVQDQQDCLESIANESFHYAGRSRSDLISHEDFKSAVDSGHCDGFLDAMELDKRDIRNLWSLICWELDHGPEKGQGPRVVQVDALVAALVKMSGAPRRIDLLMILGMLEELAETADSILNHFVPTEVEVNFLQEQQLLQEQHTRAVPTQSGSIFTEL